MKQALISFISEVQNLENELITLITVKDPITSDSAEVVESLVDECFLRLQYRLNILADSIKELLDVSEDSSKEEETKTPSNDKLVVSLISTALLNLFAKVALSCNNNTHVTRVLLDRLSLNTEEVASTQSLLAALIGMVDSDD